MQHATRAGFLMLQFQPLSAGSYFVFPRRPFPDDIGKAWRHGRNVTRIHNPNSCRLQGTKPLFEGTSMEDSLGVTRKRTRMQFQMVGSFAGKWSPLFPVSAETKTINLKAGSFKCLLQN